MKKLTIVVLMLFLLVGCQNITGEVGVSTVDGSRRGVFRPNDNIIFYINFDEYYEEPEIDVLLFFQKTPNSAVININSQSLQVRRGKFYYRGYILGNKEGFYIVEFRDPQGNVLGDSIFELRGT